MERSRSGSSSTFSSSSLLSKQPRLLLDWFTDPISHPEYSLSAELDDFPDGGMAASSKLEHGLFMYVNSYFNVDDDLQVQERLNVFPTHPSMASLFVKTTQTDCAIYSLVDTHKITLVPMEMHSGIGLAGMKATVRKCVIDCAEVLRRLRCYEGTKDCNNVTGFAFPKPGTTTGVVQVVVQFQKLKFVPQLEQLECAPYPYVSEMRLTMHDTN